MPSFRPVVSLLPLALLAVYAQPPPAPAPMQDKTSPTPRATIDAAPTRVFGFRDFTQQAAWDAEFLAVPDPALARQHLKTLTASPHRAGSPEDYATALYVAGRFKAAGLQTEIVPYTVLLDQPGTNLVEAFDAAGHKVFAGPAPAPVAAETGSAIDTSQDDPHITPPFSAWSASGDVTAPVVYANYGRLADFQLLADFGISVKGKIVLVRNGGDYRGVKVYIAQQRGARGVLLYSDPSDDGSRSGSTYPDGPFRPDSAAQLGSVQFLPIYPGDPTSPASHLRPDSQPLTASPPISCRTTCPASRSLLSPHPTQPPSCARSVASQRRASGRVACPSPITSAATTPHPLPST